MTDLPPSPDPHEVAELYASGATTDEERELVESRLRAGDSAFIEAFNLVRIVADQIAASVATVQPGDHVRETVRQRLFDKEVAPGFANLDSSQPDPFSEDPSLMVIKRSAEFDWQETGVPGVQSRNLFVDQASKRLTVLIRMAPGAHYPNHDHPGVEECMVIDGDLHIAETVLQKFDYLRTPAGGDHGEPWTENGCLLLVTCPIAGEAA